MSSSNEMVGQCDKKLRNPSIELFRCLLMFLIVLYHAFVHGIFNQTEGLWTLAFTALLVWHVDSFVAISGWFGIKWSWRKFVRLWGAILFYSVLSFAFLCWKTDWNWGGVGGFRMTAGWFGETYLMLMMVAPLLEICLSGVRRLPRRDAFRVWGLFAIAMILSWAPLGLFSAVHASGAGGYTIAMMVFLYLTVRIIRIMNVAISRLMIVGAVVFFLMGTASVWCGFEVLGLPDKVFGGVRGGRYDMYNAPYVWVMAVAMLILFVKFVRLPKSIGGIVNFIAPSMFGIYLCHDATLYGTLLYRLPEEWLSQHTGIHPAGVVAIAACVAFSLSLGIDLLRRGLVSVCLMGVRRFWLFPVVLHLRRKD